jgi:hypothetical protein
LDEVKPLALAFATPAENDIGDALTFLTRTGGEASARRFNDRLDSLLAALCVRIAAEIASDGKPFDGPYELASLRYSTPVYRERLETQARRARRSSSACGMSTIGLKISAKSARRTR